MEKFLFIFLFAVFSSSISFSQENIIQKTDTTGMYRLRDVIVTATKTQTPQLDVASSVSVIDSIQIARSNGATFLDLMQNQYGLVISQSGGPGQLAQMYLRGAGASQVIVEIDGVKMNMPDDVNNS